MRRYFIHSLEIYPVFQPEELKDDWAQEDKDASIEIPDDLIERYRRVQNEWEAVQSELAALSTGTEQA